MLPESFVEVTFEHPEDFLKIKETLTRIGIASRKDQTLYQSCHILHKRGKYYVVSFKEMFVLDGKPSSLSEEDIGRRNRIITLLVEWGLVKVVDPVKTQSPMAPISHVKIIHHRDKGNWKLVSKYSVGSRNGSP